MMYRVTDEHGQFARDIEAHSSRDAAEKYADQMHGEFDYTNGIEVRVQQAHLTPEDFTVTVRSVLQFHATRAWKTETKRGNDEATQEG